LFAAQAQGKGYGLESLQAVCRYAFAEGGIRRLVATVTAGNDASNVYWKKRDLCRKANYAKLSGWRVAGITTGCLVCCTMNTVKADNSPVIFLSLCQA
jgi:hypothetical protein